MAFANDGSFMEQFLAKMKEQEAQAGPSSDAAEKPVVSESEFIPSASFQGARPGFYFKMDVHGLGYYRDLVLEERKAAEAAKTKPPAVIKSRSFLGNVAVKGGVAKKPKDDKKEENKSKYLTEMEKYKQMSCGSDTKHDRPLVK